MKKRDLAKGHTEDKRRKAVFPVALILSAICLTFFAYGRSLNGPFVLDDLKLLDPSRLEGLFGHFRFRVRSVSVLTFALNYLVSGMNPAFFRITNIILHIISACLAFYLTSFTMGLPSMKNRFGNMQGGGSSRCVPLAVFVLFLLHPIQTSVVNYITQREAIMACMFSFAGLIFYIQGTLHTGKKALFSYILCAVSFVLAIFSKENAVMVLPMLPLYDLLFVSSFQWKEFRKRFIPLVLLFAVAAVMVISRMSVVGFLGQIISSFSHPDQALRSGGWTGTDINWTTKEYELTELRVVSRYIVLFFFPNPSWLVFDYANAYPVSKGLLNPVSSLFSLLFLLSLLFLSLKYIRRLPLISFGILWYLITIALESVIALGLDPYFEHRNYLPGFGLFLALASLFPYAGRLRAKTTKTDSPDKRREFPGWSEVALSLITLILCFLTFTRNGAWSRDDLLWKDTLAKVPLNPRALVTLSSIALDHGRFEEAEGYLRAAEALSVSGDFKYRMRINEASLYKETGRSNEAKAILSGLASEENLSRGFRNITYYLMAEVLRDEGRPAEARDYLLRAYAITQKDPGVLISLGLVSRSLGLMKEAKEYFEKVKGIAPHKFLPYTELGDMYFMEGDISRAEKNYAEALAFERDMPGDIARRVFLNLAQIRFSQGRIDESSAFFRKVLKNDPRSYQPYIFLGDIYLKKGDVDTALRYLEKAVSLNEGFVKEDPNTKLVYFNLGMAYLAKGDKGLARKNLTFFLSVAKEDSVLRSQVGSAREKLAELNPRK